MLLYLLGAIFCISSGSAQNLKFVVLGDWGTGGSLQRTVASALAGWVADNNPSFLITTGDNFYNEGIASVNDPQIQTKWKDVYFGYSSLRNLQWIITLGNHDYYTYDGREWNQVLLSDIEPTWNLPNLWHTFYRNSPAGLIQFIVVDSQAMRRQLNDWELQIPFLMEQLDTNNASAHLVFAHHPIHSSARYAPGSSTMRRNVLPLLNAYDADVYFCGHDHNLQHMRYMNGTGPDFVLSGGGGAGIYAQDPAGLLGLLAEGVDVSYFEAGGGFVGVTIDSSYINFDFIDSRGNSVYTARRRITKKKSNTHKEYNTHRK